MKLSGGQNFEFLLFNLGIFYFAYYFANIKYIKINPYIYIITTSMGSGKPRGIRAGRKLATKRRLQKYLRF
jgi:hypothetical protein